MQVMRMPDWEEDRFRLSLVEEIGRLSEKAAHALRLAAQVADDERAATGLRAYAAELERQFGPRLSALASRMEQSRADETAMTDAADRATSVNPRRIADGGDKSGP